MNVRLAFFFIPAVFAAALVNAQERPGQPGERPGAGDRPGQAGDAGGTGSLDGTWTVVSAARDGKAVDGSDKITVTIKGGVVSFVGGAGAGGADKGQMRSLRLNFGPRGIVHVSEANADGKFDASGDTGSGANPGKGTQPGGQPAAGGTGNQPGGAGAGATNRGTMHGVYVMTPDFLAISVFDSDMGAGGTGTTPGTRPGGTGTTPGAGGTTQPGTSTPGAAGTAGGLSGPQMKSHVSVVLKRSGAAGGTGNPGGAGK